MPTDPRSRLVAACVALLAGCGPDVTAAGDRWAPPVAAPAPPIEAQAAAWAPRNPGGGGAFNSPVITADGGWAVGSDLGGVFLSRDSGGSFRALGARQGLTATHIASLAAHPGGTLLIGTDDGIFLGGQDGAGIHRTLAGGYVSALCVSADPSVVYAAAHPAWDALDPYVLRSADGGATWRRMSMTLPAGLRVVALRAHPVDADAIVAVSGEGRFNTGPAEAWLSIDQGVTWGRVDPAAGDVLDVVYGVDPMNLNRMYLTVLAGDGGALYRSEDAGSSWARLAGRTGVILLDATAPGRLRLIDPRHQAAWDPDEGTWESRDGGATFSRLGSVSDLDPGWSGSAGLWGVGGSYQGALQTFGHDAARPQALLWTTSQFLFASDDGGRVFRSAVSERVGAGWRSRGIDNVVPAVVAPSAAAAGLVYAGSFDLGLWRSDDGGVSWQGLNDPAYTGNWRGVGGNALSVLPDPAREGVVWASLGGDLGDPAQPRHLLRSTARGRIGTWEEMTTGLPARPLELEGLSLDAASPVTGRTLFVAAERDVYRSRDDGRSWARVLDCDACTHTLAAGGAVYAGGGGGLWRSTRGGDAGTFSRLALPTDGWTADRTWRDGDYVGLVDVDAGGGATIWAAVHGRGLYRSADGGGTFTLVRADVHARTVAVDGRSGEVLLGSSSALYAGGYDPASHGVVRSRDGGATWRTQNAGLAFPFATQLRVAADGARWLLSPGQGVLRWQP